MTIKEIKNFYSNKVSFCNGFLHNLLKSQLYLCKRTHQDIQTAVAFLCTRVKSPDVDEYKKLTRVIQYIRDTQDITLMIEADNNPHWWVDSSYTMHPDMKSHTGVLMSIGKGCTYRFLRNKNLIRRAPLKPS